MVLIYIYIQIEVRISDKLRVKVDRTTILDFSYKSVLMKRTSYWIKKQWTRLKNKIRLEIWIKAIIEISIMSSWQMSRLFIFALQENIYLSSDTYEEKIDKVFSNINLRETFSLNGTIKLHFKGNMDYHKYLEILENFYI